MMPSLKDFGSMFQGGAAPDMVADGRFVAGHGPMGGGRTNYQSAYDRISRKLEQAQMTGAPPSVIANLQMDLEQLERNKGREDRGMQERFLRNQMGQASLAQNRPPGIPVGGAGRQQEQEYQIRNREQGTQTNLMQQILQLMMGGGGR